LCHHTRPGGQRYVRNYTKLVNSVTTEVMVG